MGSYLSRDVDRVEAISDAPSSSSSFPPQSGAYFAPYYFMGSEKFETSQPESYLFGENSDLQYLGPKAQPFSYRMPARDQLVQALKCLVNIRKDSLRLIRAPNATNKSDDVISTNESCVNNENTPPPKLYNLEFTFDADCPCSIKVYYNASETVANGHVKYTSKSDKDCSDLLHFNAGSNQQFCLPTHIIHPACLNKVNTANNPSNKWNFDCIPIVIQVSVENDELFPGHCHIAYAAFEQVSDEGWTVKLLKQKQMIDGVCYIIQEIYGIENKAKSKRDDDAAVSDGYQDSDDGGDNTECVVCLSDMKDTIILPCKHLCLCSDCANQIRFQQSGCPICRQSFRALLQIRAVRKSSGPLGADPNGGERESIAPRGGENEADEEDEEDGGLTLPPLPEGYEAVPLIDAINGPSSTTAALLPSMPVGSSNRASSATSPTTAVAPSSSGRSRSNSLYRSSRRKKKTSVVHPQVEIEDETVTSQQQVLANVSNTPDSQQQLRRSNTSTSSSKKKRSKRSASTKSIGVAATTTNLEQDSSCAAGTSEANTVALSDDDNKAEEGSKVEDRKKKNSKMASTETIETKASSTAEEDNNEQGEEKQTKSSSSSVADQQ